MMATNLRAPYLLARSLAPRMIKTGEGRILNIISTTRQGVQHRPVSEAAMHLSAPHRTGVRVIPDWVFQHYTVSKILTDSFAGPPRKALSPPARGGRGRATLGMRRVNETSGPRGCAVSFSNRKRIAFSTGRVLRPSGVKMIPYSVSSP